MFSMDKKESYKRETDKLIVTPSNQWIGRPLMKAYVTHVLSTY